MDEHAFYVWSAWGVAALVMTGMLAAALRQRAKARAAARRHGLS